MHVRCGHGRGSTGCRRSRASGLFASIGEGEKEAFCQLRAARLSEGEYWVHDTTSISSYFEALCQARRGRNKDKVALPRLNMAVTLVVKVK